jgi:hypothetical protein
MLRGIMIAAAGAAALSLGSVGAATAGTVSADAVAGLSKDFAHSYEAGAKYYYVAPRYKYYKPRVVVRPYYPVYPVYKVKRKYYY